MYLITVWIASIFMITGSIYYCYEIYLNKVSPPPATFIILSITFPLSFWMYMQKLDWSYTSNIGLTSATIGVWIVCIFLIRKLIYERRLSVEIDNFQRLTIASSLMVLLFWFITQNSFTAYVLLQVSALIGYLPLILILLKSKKNPDSLVLWSCVLFSNLVASYTAWEKNDIESWIYIGRSVPSTFLIVILMIRLKKKTQKLA